MVINKNTGYNQIIRYYTNPILPGFYPDPSICRVGDDYYMVTSTFAYFPGVPIFQSKDLVHWEQIGHVLDRESQLKLTGAGQSGGIFAPTIRYHKGTFFMITTNVSGGGNFIVTTEDPAGPWSEPHFLDAPGIDPSLFFDDDGKVYYVGTRGTENEKFFGDNDIWLQELDLASMKLIGETYVLWRGALKDVAWPEGPHIYKKDGYYYLLISEAGTGHEHALTIARSKVINEPYEGYNSNPIFTHRHLGYHYPIVNIGHADMVETQNGEWWMVLLGSRPYGGYYRNLGRETFLVPMIWENGWPVINPGKGIVEEYHVVPNLPEYRIKSQSACDNFDNRELAFQWVHLRNPIKENYSLAERPGFLRLKLAPERIADLASPSFVGRRQQHMSFSAGIAMEFVPKTENEMAGLVINQSEKYNYNFLYTIIDGNKTVLLMKCTEGKEEVLAVNTFEADRIYLKIQAWGQDLGFYYGSTPDTEYTLAENVDARMLSTDVAGGFVGNTIGMYASSNGIPSDNHADFDWFEYTGE